jgi:hypothetical protein
MDVRNCETRLHSGGRGTERRGGKVMTDGTDQCKSAHLL